MLHQDVTLFTAELLCQHGALGFEKKVEKEDYLRSNCALCLHRNPVEQDEMIADRVEEEEGLEPFPEVGEVEKKSDKEKNLTAPRFLYYR